MTRQERGEEFKKQTGVDYYTPEEVGAIVAERYGISRDFATDFILSALHQAEEDLKLPFEKLVVTLMRGLNIDREGFLESLSEPIQQFKSMYDAGEMPEELAKLWEGKE